MGNKDTKILLDEIKRILSAQDQIIDHKVSKTVLKQTGLFFISLAILVAVWSAGFGFVLRGQNSLEKNIKAEIKTINSEVTNNKIQMTEINTELENIKHTVKASVSDKN